jgi:hypothetical protein
VPNQHSRHRKVQLSSAQVAALSLIAGKVRCYPYRASRQFCTAVYLFDLGLIAQDVKAPVLDPQEPVWVTDAGKAMLRRIAGGDAMVVVR